MNKRISTKRLWMQILLGEAALMCAVIFVIACFREIPAEGIIQEIILALLGAGLGLAAATVPENLKKIRQNNEN